ncbi:serine O-acetyltransferase, partial [Singulisphaera rosea]
MVVLIAYRFGHALHRRRERTALWAPVFFFYKVAYTLLTEWLLALEIKLSTRIGPGLQLEHGMGLVVNQNAVIGAGCVLRQNTTIGEKPDGVGGFVYPWLEDDVVVGANAVILGGVTIGRGAVIGAGAVVTRSVPAGAVAVGN